MQEENIIQVKFLGVIKGLAGKEKIAIHVDKEITLYELLRMLGEKFGEEFKNRIFSGDKISPDLLITYNEKIFPARNNEKLPIKAGSELTIFSFVHGG